VVLLSEVGRQAAEKGPAYHSCCLGNLETHGCVLLCVCGGWVGGWVGGSPSASGVVRQ
jgi:hypothetical protein